MVEIRTVKYLFLPLIFRTGVFFVLLHKNAKLDCASEVKISKRFLYFSRLVLTLHKNAKLDYETN